MKEAILPKIHPGWRYECVHCGQRAWLWVDIIEHLWYAHNIDNARPHIDYVEREDETNC